MQRKVYILENLDCANCAAKIERKLSKLPELSDVSVTFATKQLRFAAEDPEAVLPKIRETIQSMEPDVEVVERTRSRRKAAETHNHEQHHHEHGEECGCGHDHHDHEHHDEHDHHGHDHCHDEAACDVCLGHEHGHEHHHDHDEAACDACCGHHHHHGHDADEVFTSWGRETPRKYSREDLQDALSALAMSEDYGYILRAKGMVPCDDGQTWLHFDLVPEEFQIREGAADYTGRLCVIGSGLDEAGLEKLFQLV